MNVAAEGAAEEHAETRRTFLDRVVAAYPVLTLYVVLSFLYCWQASGRASPFVFSDELEWAELSRGIAATGHAMLRLHQTSPGSIYAYLIAPAWWLDSTERGYEAVKYIGTLTMTASLIPAYLLARTLVSRPLALFAAAGTAMVPALVYGAMIIPEPLAYTYSSVCLYAGARALATRSRGWIAASLALLVAAPAVRAQLAVLLAAAPLAAAVFAATSERGRRVIGSWTWAQRIGAAALGLGVAILLNATLTHRSYSWQVGTAFSHRMLEYGAWAVGAFAIGVGVFPAIATLAWVLSAHQRKPEERAFLAVAASSLLVFVLYTAVKASYLSTTLATRVEERNLIYLSPVVFVGAAVWLASLRARATAVAVATAAIVWALVITPYQMDHHLYSDAPGLAVLAAANRAWAWNDAYAQNVLLWMAGVSAAVLLLPIVLRRLAPSLLSKRTIVATATAVIAVAALGWAMTAEVTAANAAKDVSESAIGSMPKPPDWIDAQTDRARTLFLGQRVNENAFYPLEFWNQSIGEAWTLDATTPPPGPSLTPNLASPDGTLDPQRDVKWVVGVNGVTVVGEPVEVHGATTLYRIAPPLRIRDASSGVYDDGWIGHDASFAVYSTPGGGSGTAKVIVSRSGASGREPRSRVRLRLGTVRIDENGQPQIKRVLAERHFTVGGREVHAFSFPAKPPYRVEIHVDRTFKPSDFGSSDARELGAQVAHRFVSAER